MAFSTNQLKQTQPSSGDALHILAQGKEFVIDEYNRRYLFYKPNKKQLEFHKASNYALVRCLFGANRSGKTFAGIIEVCMHATGNYPANWEGRRFDHPTSGWVVSTDYKASRDIVQDYIVGSSRKKGLILSKDLASIKKLSGSSGAIDFINIQHKSGGISQMIFMSYQAKVDAFKGVQRDYVLLDEEPPMQIYSECVMRLTNTEGTGPNGLMLVTMTPQKGYSEFITSILKRELKYENGQSEMINNPEGVLNGSKWFQFLPWEEAEHLSEEAKAVMLEAIPEYEREARTTGRPSMGNGMVYPVPESKFVIPRNEEPEILPSWGCVIGLDLGYRPSPTAGVFAAWDKDNDIIYIYKEYYVTERTIPQHAYYLNMLGSDWIPIVCDPSARIGDTKDGRRALDEYSKAGINMTVASYGKETAVDMVLERIRSGRFKVFASCTRFLDEWRSYGRDKYGKIQKGNDHLMNALEFVMTDGLQITKTKNQAEVSKMYQSKPRRF